jgi:uncharacterized protein (TIGR03435 family)
MSTSIGSRSAKFLIAIASFVVMGQRQAVLDALPQAAPPAFEVVSIRVNKPGQVRELSLRYLPGGRFSATAVPIPVLVADAYDTARLNPSPEFQKLDLRAIERDLYDIEAIAPKDAIPAGTSSSIRNNKLKEMLRTLLADRFKLRVHYETKEQTVYAITVAKNGPKLEGGDQCADKPVNFFDPSSCHSVSDLAMFAQRTARLEFPVIDKTGLTGLYNMQTVDWSAIIPGPNRPEDLTKPTFADVLGRLGLKLETQKAVVDMLFVDHVEVPSTEN